MKLPGDLNALLEGRFDRVGLRPGSDEMRELVDGYMRTSTAA